MAPPNLKEHIDYMFWYLFHFAELLFNPIFSQYDHLPISIH